MKLPSYPSFYIEPYDLVLERNSIKLIELTESELKILYRSLGKIKQDPTTLNVHVLTTVLVNELIYWCHQNSINLIQLRDEIKELGSQIKAVGIQDVSCSRNWSHLRLMLRLKSGEVRELYENELSITEFMYILHKYPGARKNNFVSGAPGCVPYYVRFKESDGTTESGTNIYAASKSHAMFLVRMESLFKGESIFPLKAELS